MTRHDGGIVHGLRSVIHGSDHGCSASVLLTKQLLYYDEVAGIKLPTKHGAFPRTAAGESLAEPFVVSIDVTEIAFAERIPSII